MAENAFYSPMSTPKSLNEYVGEQNIRLGRMAALLARIQRYKSRRVSAAYTLTDADDVLLVTTSGGSVTLTLPVASTLPGKRYEIKKMDAANTLTVQRSGSDTIDGATTLAWTTQYQSYSLVSCETATATFNWVIV